MLSHDCISHDCISHDMTLHPHHARSCQQVYDACKLIPCMKIETLLFVEEEEKDFYEDDPDAAPAPPPNPPPPQRARFGDVTGDADPRERTPTCLEGQGKTTERAVDSHRACPVFPQDDPGGLVAAAY